MILFIMKKKIKWLICVIILIGIFIQILYFNPFTAKSAVRWSVLWQGFVCESYTIDVEKIPESEIGEIGDLTLNDFSSEQTLYRVVSPELRNDSNGIRMQYWIVTLKMDFITLNFPDIDDARDSDYFPV